MLEFWCFAQVNCKCWRRTYIDVAESAKEATHPDWSGKCHKFLQHSLLKAAVSHQIVFLYLFLILSSEFVKLNLYICRNWNVNAILHSFPEMTNVDFIINYSSELSFSKERLRKNVKKSGRLQTDTHTHPDNEIQFLQILFFSF